MRVIFFFDLHCQILTKKCWLHSLSDGRQMRLITLQDEFKDEYEALTQMDREELIEEFVVQHDERTKIKRPTPKA